MTFTCDTRSCRRVAVLELHDLTDDTRTYRCDRHQPITDGRFAAVELRKVCEYCGKALPAVERPQGGGRAKRYCSGTCRTAAHRQAAHVAT